MTPAHALLLLLAAPLRVFVDAGHGEPNNRGVQLVSCEAEEAVTLRIASVLADTLRARGMAVKSARTTTPGSSYAVRRDEANAWNADALVSIHVDARYSRDQLEGKAPRPPPPPGGCNAQTDSPGFSVIYSDWGDARLVERRRALARSVARALIERGFVAQEFPRDLAHFGYVRDRAAGVMIERRVLFILRRPRAPAIIIETHNGLNPREAAEWRRPETIRAFSEAVAAGLIGFARSPAQKRAARPAALLRRKEQ